MLRRLPTLLLVCLGAALFSQAPEFAQQYRQRLGGALDELRSVARDFERDAQAANLTAEAALARMTGSADGFVRDRGASMGRTLARFARVQAQAAAFERAGPWWRPVALAQGGDRAIMAATWGAFEPAVPLTGPGLVWGLLGAGLFGIAGGAAGAAVRRATRPRLRIGGSQRA